MKLTVTGRENGVVRLACSGTITTFEAAERVDMWLAALGPEGYAETVLLDLSKADYLDSNGVSWFILAHLHFLMYGGRLILHSLPPRLQQTVELLELPSVLDIVADETAARALLRKAATMRQSAPQPSLCPRAVLCFVFGALSPALLFLTGVPALWMGVDACASSTPAKVGLAVVAWRLRVWFSAVSAAPPPSSDRSSLCSWSCACAANDWNASTISVGSAGQS